MPTENFQPRHVAATYLGLRRFTVGRGAHATDAEKVQRVESNPCRVDTTHDGDTVCTLTAICETRNNNSQNDVIGVRSVTSQVRDIAMINALKDDIIIALTICLVLQPHGNRWKRSKRRGGRGEMMWGRDELGRGEG